VQLIFQFRPAVESALIYTLLWRNDKRDQCIPAVFGSYAKDR